MHDILQDPVPVTGDSGAIDFGAIRLVLFDLDGTLVDSLPDLAWCGNRMLRGLGLPERDQAAIGTWVGNGVERFVKRLLTGAMEAEPDDELFARALPMFMDLYADHISVHSRIYPGVREALETLSRKNLHLGCVTNKAERFTHDLLAALALEAYFPVVVGGDTTARKKPDPMPLHYAADHFGLDYDRCLMVGDSNNDVVAARAAGFAIACVPYGYNHGVDIRLSGPDLVVDNLARLAALFD